MLSPYSTYAMMNRACGHQEQEKISYSGTVHRNKLMMTGRNMICAQCASLVSGWFADSEKSSYDLNLPALIGTQNAIKWAYSIREKQVLPLLKVLSSSSHTPGNLGKGITMAIYALATQARASFWIDNRDMRYTPEYFSQEAAYFLSHNLYGVYFHRCSIYVHMNKNQSANLKRIKSMFEQAKTASA